MAPRPRSSAVARFGRYSTATNVSEGRGRVFLGREHSRIGFSNEVLKSRRRSRTEAQRPIADRKARHTGLGHTVPGGDLLLHLREHLLHIVVVARTIREHDELVATHPSHEVRATKRRSSNVARDASFHRDSPRLRVHRVERVSAVRRITRRGPTCDESAFICRLSTYYSKIVYISRAGTLASEDSCRGSTGSDIACRPC
jgi:hypothetical protein